MRVSDIPELFSLEHTVTKELFGKGASLFEIITKIKDFCRANVQTLDDGYEEIFPEVFVAKDAEISKNATIIGPTIIGHGTEVRPGAFIRGSAIIGNGAVIGNSTEIKNAIIFDEVQLPHYNYVGDSILGYRAHLGAGAIISNFRLDRQAVTVKTENGKINSGMRKLGALVGDFCEIGCNSVIYPGSILGRGTIVYPLSYVNGMVNLGQKIQKREREQI